MASRTSLIQSRSIYVGTSNNVAPSDGNLIVTGNVGIGTTSPSDKLHVAGGFIYNYGAQNVSGFKHENAGGGHVVILNANDSYAQLYTTGSTPLMFGTSNAERMRIDTSGNVGIGTTSPNVKLHIKDSSAGTKLIIETTGTTGEGYSELGFTAGSSVGYIWLANNSATSWGGAGSLNIYTQGAMTFYAGGTEKMRVTSGGNVGIGTSAPTSKLHLTSGGSNAYSSTITRGSNMVGIVNTISSNADEMVGIYFATGSAIGTHWSGITGSRTDNAAHWGTQLNFYTHDENTSNLNDATQKMVIKGSGNVGIGTDNPAFTSGDGLEIQRSSATATLRLDSGVFATELRAYTDGTFLGQLSNSYLDLGTDNTTRVRIGAGGYVGIGTTSAREKLQVSGNTVIGSPGLNSYKTNLYLSYSASTDETWFRIYLPQDYNSSNNGGTVKVKVLWEADHASFGAYQEYQVSYKTYYPSSPYLVFSNVLCMNKTSDFSTGSTYYPPSSTPDVLFYDNSDGYLYVKVKGTHASYNNARYVEAEIFGRTTSQPTIATTTAPASATELTKTIQFLPQEGNIYASGNVGIGTTSPSYKLDVATGDDNAIRITNSLGSNTNGLALAVGSGTPWLDFNGASFNIKYNTSPGSWNSGANSHLTILSGGNVGIGTTSPSYKLQVNGSIWARPTSDGTSGTAIHMGRFTDTDTPAYSFITDDYNGDTLYLYSQRWGIDYKIQRASSSGTKEVFRVNGEDTNGHFAKLYDASNTVAIQLSSNGNSYLNGGNVGIGTTSPQTTLHVNGEIRWGGGTAAPYVYSGIDSVGLYIEQVDNNTGKDKIRFQTRTNNTGSYTSFVIDANAQNFAFNRGDITLADGYRIWLRGSSSSSATGAQSYIYSDGLNLKIKGDDNVQLLGDGGGVILHADYTGNVGIGTTSPASKLQIGSVGSTGYSVGNGLAFGDGTRAAALNVESSGLNIYSSSHIKLSPNTTEKVRITTDGNVGIGTTSPAYTLDVAGTSRSDLHIFRSNQSAPTADAFIFRPADNTIALGTANSERMRIDASGNVGINVTAPTHKLHVNGKAYFQEYGGAHLTNYAYSTYQFDSLANHSSATTGGSLGAIMKLTSAATSATGTFNAIRTRAYAEDTTVNTDWLINYWADYRNYTSTSAVTLSNHAAFSVTPLGVGGSATVTNNYGIYLDPGATATNNYGVYQIGSTVKNYFAGNVGIGTTSPASESNLTLGAKSASEGGHLTLQKGTSASNATHIDNFSNTFRIMGGSDSASGGVQFLLDHTTGNVGIGTTSPDAKLHVASGKVAVDNTSSSTDVRYGGSLLALANSYSALDNIAAIDFPQSAAGSGFSRIGVQYKSRTASQETQDMFFVTMYGGTSSEKMRILGNGNVGIGATNPQSKLTVVGEGDGTVQMGSTGFGGDWVGISLSGTLNTTNYNLLGSQSNSSFYLNRPSGGDMLFRHNNTDQVIIKSGGNVGIGTTSPDSKFHVEDTNPEVRITGTGGTSFPRLLWEYPVSATQASRWALTASASGNTFYLYNYTQSKKIFQVDGTASHITLNHDAAGTTQIGTSTTQTAYQLYVATNIGQTGAIEAAGSVKITSGALGVNIAASATAGRIDASNDIVAYSTSDHRLKENIKPLENATEKVKKLTGVEFDWKQEHKAVHGYEGHDVGVIAQEVQEVLPEAIRTNDSGYLSVRYEKLIGLLIESNKELAARVEELEQKLKQ